ncbi:shikimate dehydrogenase [Halalkalicoccus jeotgali]|uniref:Shikimate dehydrogenase (NADP(+)) n=1 Tax=Halalkalicoccus jeotgali (strain DSM 18796 / CECT 7217 / JCM 14584 / KCTC 4019 / B3) TaxID=795797 RepID=D8J6W2_HALJB|nr:shikimate dehydrogenase [Halalkalicoccus jeotgali]ADJ15915.1 shikimate 5-dehydrogenase [Halalkalicoccus jeotgali B3]ELY38011.1 shikimate 5-dehydrogenase [Halalkalicoccus jeotgali B3]
MDVYGLLGNPVGHSLSPPMHEAAYRELGMDARYVTFEPDPESLEAAISGASALGIKGLNVTIPFKQEVLTLVELDDLADRIGAVNTIDLTGTPTGYNTDAAGARRALERHDVDLDGARAVLIGAGGAARAIAFVLADEGATIQIANRTKERAEELATAVPQTTGHGLPDLPDLLENADVLINATSVGMETDTSPVPAESLHRHLTVMDVVYRPLETRLLRDAKQTGAETVDGGWMLLYQGVEALERWTGREAPVEAMNETLRGELTDEAGAFK